jgi:diguanylate cyclase (GGDEF)-like protein
VTYDREHPDIETMDDGTDEGLLPPPPSGWSDPLTGTDGPRLWDRLVSSELARVRRYHRPATVALIEIAGMGPFASLWGADVAERTFVKLARTLAVEIRSSDHIARIDRTRFAILLTETDEVAAINFIERARAACERHLTAPSSTIRIAIGWASPTATNDLRATIDLAEQRLSHELQSSG